MTRAYIDSVVRTSSCRILLLQNGNPGVLIGQFRGQPVPESVESGELRRNAQLLQRGMKIVLHDVIPAPRIRT